MTVYENIRFQLPFIRVITETEECLHISIGPQTSQTIMENFLKWIKKHISDYNIVLLHNIELPSSTKSKKSDEQNQIAKLIQ